LTCRTFDGNPIVERHVIERIIATTTHGRYLVEPATNRAGPPILVGFHGYAEGADAMLDRLRAIPGADGWTLVSVQALNRFYRGRTNDVIAGWMTRQDRELAIADNTAYVTAVLDEVCGVAARDVPIVFAGFSQGVAMTFRAAAASTRPVSGVIAVGGDVPPEIGGEALARVRAALVCHGRRDDWYTPEKFATDIERLRGAAVAVTPFDFDGGHEWSIDVNRACAAFLRERHR
jgi:predicted esterase